MLSDYLQVYGFFFFQELLISIFSIIFENDMIRFNSQNIIRVFNVYYLEFFKGEKENVVEI